MSERSHTKRSIRSIIQTVYEFLERVGGEAYVSNLRQTISNPTTALDIIRYVQEQPYIYFKTYSEKKRQNAIDRNHSERDLSKKGEKKALVSKTYTILKLSSHKRDPKIRYLQLEEVIRYLEANYEKMNEETCTKADLIGVLRRTLDALYLLSNQQTLPTNYFV